MKKTPVIVHSASRWIVVAFIPLAPPRLLAQSPSPATLTGAVFQEATRDPVAGATITLPALHLEGTSDVYGVYRVTGIPAGSHYVVVRRLGFQEVSLRLSFSSADTLRQLFLLKRIEQLEPITVSERRSYIPGFDERRRLGAGHALDRQDLATVEHRSLSDVISRLPGLRIARGNANRAWVTGGRGQNGFTVWDPEPADKKQGARRACYSLVYLDGNQVFGGSGPLFDINLISATDLEAVEYFSGGANTPPEFRQTGSACGVLAIWTRRAAR